MVEQDYERSTEIQEDPFGLVQSTVRERPELRWQDDQGNTQRFRVDRRAVVGSAPHVDVVLRDATVSRLHAEVEMRSDGLWLRDLGSLNGSFIEGVRVASARLDEGLRVRMGATTFTVVYDHQTAPVALWPADRFGPVLGRSVPMREFFMRLNRAAECEATVLIQGETGTGKELLAAALHEASARVDGPLMVVDCGALHGGLLEAEIFGHAKGAFTGAVNARTGAAEAAHGGTLFLDEVGELPLSLQPKLLRLVESRTVSRVGENQQRSVDVRFIVATNQDLKTMVNEGTFREDLYFRLAVLELAVPPLRERTDDIQMLVEHFLPRGSPPPAKALMAELAKRPWHGNVRELRNFVERAVAFGPDAALQQVDHSRRVPGETALPMVPLDVPFKQIREAWLDHLEREYVSGLLKRCNHNVSAVAEAAGLNRTYIHKLIRKHDL